MTYDVRPRMHHKLIPRVFPDLESLLACYMTSFLRRHKRFSKTGPPNTVLIESVSIAAYQNDKLYNRTEPGLTQDYDLRLIAFYKPFDYNETIRSKIGGPQDNAICRNEKKRKP